MSEEKSKASFRISMMPGNIDPALIKELDKDNDGEIDVNEFAQALDVLRNERKTNRKLSRVVMVLVVCGLLLIASIFGVSIAAAYYAKDTKIYAGGILLDKENDSIVQTAEAVGYMDQDTAGSLVDMTTDRIQSIKTISLFDGKLSFAVKGSSKSPSGDQLMLLVEGGTITFDSDGFQKATGDALVLFEHALGEMNEGRRMLFRSLSESDSTNSTNSTNIDEGRANFIVSYPEKNIKDIKKNKW